VPIADVPAELLAEREVEFWGRKHTIKPALVARVFGDGGQLIAFAPLDTRPNYYVVRIDSGWCLDNWDSEATDPFNAHIDEVYDAIEDEYGLGYDPDDEDEERYEPFPALHDSSGCQWSALDCGGD